MRNALMSIIVIMALSGCSDSRPDKDSAIEQMKHYMSRHPADYDHPGSTITNEKYANGMRINKTSYRVFMSYDMTFTTEAKIYSLVETMSCDFSPSENGWIIQGRCEYSR